jgi:hypothetical protein
VRLTAFSRARTRPCFTGNGRGAVDADLEVERGGGERLSGVDLSAGDVAAALDWKAAPPGWRLQCVGVVEGAEREVARRDQRNMCSVSRETPAA